MRCAISPNDPRIWDLVRVLDVDETPAAETWRKVAAAAERLQLSRPSYGHVRRLVRIERVRRRLRTEQRQVAFDLATGFAVGRVPSVPKALEEIRELRLHEELVLQKHKRPP